MHAAIQVDQCGGLAGGLQKQLDRLHRRTEQTVFVYESHPEKLCKKSIENHMCQGLDSHHFHIIENGWSIHFHFKGV